MNTHFRKKLENGCVLNVDFKMENKDTGEIELEKIYKNITGKIIYYYNKKYYICNTVIEIDKNTGKMDGVEYE